MIRPVTLVLVCLILIHCSRAPRQEVRENAVVSLLPSLDVQLTSGEKINTQSLHGKIILIFFNPDCDHCQRQAEDVSNNMTSFKNESIYFIGSNTLEELNRFSQTYKLSQYPNVFFATATIENVSRVMGQIGVPSIYIYSDKGVLMKKFDNETKVHEIAQFL